MGTDEQGSSRQSMGRFVTIAGRATSVSLEDAFWQSLKEMRDMTRSELVAKIDSKRQEGNLSTAIRLFVLDFYRQQIPLRKRPRSKG